MCTSPSLPPLSAVISSRLPKCRELIPAGADSVYIQRRSDKPYQPAQLKRSRPRKEGLAPAQCQPLWPARVFSCLSSSPRGLCSERGATKTPPLVRAAVVGFTQRNLQLLALILVQITLREKGHCPSGWWESASSVSSLTLCHPHTHFSLLPASMGWGFLGISILTFKNSSAVIAGSLSQSPPCSCIPACPSQ